MEPTTSRRNICVVGAGAAGLPSIRHALLYGFNVVCYEAQSELGGLWRFNPEDTEYSCVMRSTVINTSKEFTAYSDFPPLPEEPNFMHNSRMLNYLKAYADHFKLTDHIQFEHKALSISRADKYDASGQWDVRVQNMKSSEITTTRFDGVLHCTGHHALPYSPALFPGQETFPGRVMHAHDYKDWRGFENQTIVVVGVGNSGCDIAVELSRVAKQVHLVSRRGTWVYNRIYNYGRPVDCTRYTRLNAAIKEVVPHSIAAASVRKQLNFRFDHELYGLKPKHDVMGAHPTINDELPNRIANGSIRVRPQINRFNGTTVHFEDGSMTEGVDTVILSTGYTVSFPEIESGELIKVDNNQVDLFQYVFPMCLPHDSLGIIGLIQPFGSIIPIAEMQARLVLAAIAGEDKMPVKTEREAIMSRKAAEMSKRYVQSRRHTVQVDYLPYMDELASLIGCDVPAWYTHLPHDQTMARLTLTAPHTAYFYRLSGPHAWDGAREAIMGIEERISRAFNSNHLKATAQSATKISPGLFLVIAAILFVLLVVS
ncbi:hypothetical protein PRIPAC_93662 [Pristionchus pacificus]|uniref:Flavin-containing monooxygenase n=1 Tax=Pristionchus pacificus TaxID=54126 RepID=A0A2A6CE31_PRIPA|nr:hypothetical protein PRIPAC_93662 [Pristionchus pacificus]|eukprot:PDM76462.1 FAD dependent oxidoreductase [Pristionchus pacificus]